MGPTKSATQGDNASSAKPNSAACSHDRFQVLFPWHRVPGAPGVAWCRCARQGTELRRRLSKLSYAGWVPHDRGFVLGLPLSRIELRSCRLITGHEVSPPRSVPSVAHRHRGRDYLSSSEIIPSSACELAQAALGSAVRAIAQINPTISRAIAVVITTLVFPAAARCR